MPIETDGQARDEAAPAPIPPVPAEQNHVKTTLRPNRRGVVVENPEFAAFAARILRAAARRVAEGDVEGLAALVALRSELDDAITLAVDGLREPQWSYSWSETARVLGTTKQAAQQRNRSKPASR